jgi:hypothetical protein
LNQKLEQIENHHFGNMIGGNTFVNDDSKLASPLACLLAHSLGMLTKSFPKAPLFLFCFPRLKHSLSFDQWMTEKK